MEDDLSQSNKIARERQERNQRDIELWRIAYHSLTRQLERTRDSKKRELERAREIQRELERARDSDREEIMSYLDNLITDKQTDKRTYRAIP